MWVSSDEHTSIHGSIFVSKKKQDSELFGENIAKFDFQLVENSFKVLECDVLLLTFKILDSVNCHGR